MGTSRNFETKRIVLKVLRESLDARKHNLKFNLERADYASASQQQAIIPVLEQLIKWFKGNL